MNTCAALLFIVLLGTGSPGTTPTGEHREDPGHSLYSRGYASVLDEHWTEARDRFDELLRRFPKSEYADDAEYWRAYVLGQSDPRRGIEAYRMFLRNRKGSPYVDDAMADLGVLELRLAPRPPSPPRVTVRSGEGNAEFTVQLAPNIRQLERELRRQELYIRALRLPDHPPVAPIAPPGIVFEQALDEESSVRMEALLALGRPPGDERSFVTLRQVAVDPAQKTGLRVAALDALSAFETVDPFPVFVEVAQRDTSLLVRSYAIDCIGGRARDPNRSVEALIELYRSGARDRREQASTLFFAIADIGSDRAVDFFAEVAKSDREPEYRRQAAYYLGIIGGERARVALEEILRGR